MRTLKTSIVVCGLLAHLPALAQQAPAPAAPAPAEPAQPAEDVPLEPGAPPMPGEEPEAAPPPAAPPAANPAGAEAPPPPPMPAAEASATAEVATPPTPAVPRTFGGPTTADEDVWRFNFSGYFRAPMRIGLGSRDNPTSDQSGTTLHSPVIPDDQYLSWQHTKHNQRDWAELFFSVGNSFATGTVAIQGFNFTDVAWADPEAQFGVSQGWITLTPELPWENVRLIWKVGSFWNRYGMAGRYDSGQYDTFLFGRTHVMGETLRMEFDINEYTLSLEHGIGTKRPNPSIYNRGRFTFLNHAHAGLSWDKSIEVTGHFLHAFTQEEDRVVASEAPFPLTFTNPVPDGSMMVFGGDLRIIGGPWGYFYGGFSRVQLEHGFTVAPAIEVIHSFGGGEFSLGVVDNYLEPAGATGAKGACADNLVLDNPQCSGGNGAVNTILGQYELSVGSLLGALSDGSPFPEGQDLNLTLYGMVNMVESDNEVMDGITKLKYGADLSYTLFPALSIATRFDRLQPNSDIPEQSFAILSPRLTFRSQLVTREQISLQYSRYFYNQRECGDDPLACVRPAPSGATPEGFGSIGGLTQPELQRGAPTTRPDVNVVKIEASMWW